MKAGAPPQPAHNFQLSTPPSLRSCISAATTQLFVISIHAVSQTHSAGAKLSMEGKKVAMVGVLMGLLVAMSAVQQASAACGNVNNLASCLSSARTGAQPTQACCQAMASFAEYGTPAGEACLCQAVNNPTAKAAGAQPQFAILIPQKCNLNYKAGFVCNGVVVPGGHA